jgi:bacterioferritin-associated ferredoxin
MILKFIIKNTEEMFERFAWELKAMLVCLCKGVSDKKIRSLVENGASSVRQVMSTCHAGQDCGACICTVRDIIRQTRGEGAASDGGSEGSDE